jgi:NodT family efflux transporter outer membrane factor (OMF) lipoprotein
VRNPGRNGVCGLAPLAVSAMVACALCSCAVGPNFHRPAPPATESYLPDALPDKTVEVAGPAGAAQRFLSGQEISAEWWKLFQSEELNALVAQALSANPSVAQAKASLRAAQEAAAAQRGEYWPQFQAGFSATRQKNALGVLSPTLSTPEALFNLYTPQLTVSFAPDVFGGNRRQVESLVATADAARFELDATYLTLINNVIATVVQMAGLQEQLRETEHMVSLESESLEVLRHALALGSVAGSDVAAQETALAQTQATAVPLRHQLEVQRHQLAALVGKLPGDSPVLKLTLSDLHLPTEIPLSLPSRLVERRPDVLAAEAQLHAATAQVGVALADMLPQFDITGGIGSVATMMSDLFKNGTGFWSAGGSLTQTLFDGGELLHKKREADAMLDEAGASYRATVLSAFQNVADALHALTSDADALEANTRAAGAAQNSYDIARRQLDLGSVNYLYLLVAEQNYLQARVALIVAQSNRLADTAALFQALGGSPPSGK